MSWVTTVSIVLITLLALNSFYVVFWLRPKLGEKEKSKNEKVWNRKVSLSELFVSVLVVACGLAAIAIPVMAPTSYLAKWITEHGIINYAIWCIFGIVAIGIITSLIGLIWKRDGAA